MTDSPNINAKELLSEIEAGLHGTTKGKWHWRNDINKREYNLSPGVLITSETDGTPWGDKFDRANAAHIVRCSPDNLLAIIEYVRELEAENKRLRYALGLDDPDGMIDEIDNAIADSFDVDWNSFVGATHVFDLLKARAALPKPPVTDEAAA